MKKAILTAIMVLTATIAFAETDMDMDYPKFVANYRLNIKSAIDVCEDLKVPGNMLESDIAGYMGNMNFEEIKDKTLLKKVVALYELVGRDDTKIESTTYYIDKGVDVVAYVQYIHGKSYIYGCTSLHDRHAIAK